MNKKPAFVWIDLETTGLNPDTDCILEIGVMITDRDLDEIARAQWFVDDGDALDRIANADDVVRKMHEKSGLWRELATAPARNRSRVVAESECAAFIREHCPDPLPLAGSTIGFDRSFLRVHAPRVLDVVHYRSLDVSSLKLLANAWGYPPAVKTREAVHRAIPDLEDSIAELRHYRSTMLRS